MANTQLATAQTSSGVRVQWNPLNPVTKWRGFQIYEVYDGLGMIAVRGFDSDYATIIGPVIGDEIFGMIVDKLRAEGVHLAKKPLPAITASGDIIRPRVPSIRVRESGPTMEAREIDSVLNPLELAEWLEAFAARIRSMEQSGGGDFIGDFEFALKVVDCTCGEPEQIEIEMNTFWSMTGHRS